MQRIHLDEGVTLRFPGRDEEFAAGVEAGILAVHMDQQQPVITRWIADSNVVQLRVLADSLGYVLVVGAKDQDMSFITLRRRGQRPRLSLVGADK